MPGPLQSPVVPLEFAFMYQSIQFSKSSIPPTSSTSWALDILNVQLLKSSSPWWWCSNAQPL